MEAGSVMIWAVVSWFSALPIVTLKERTTVTVSDNRQQWNEQWVELIFNYLSYLAVSEESLPVVASFWVAVHQSLQVFDACSFTTQYYMDDVLEVLHEVCSSFADPNFLFMGDNAKA
ncbi:hypothetical protein TNCV_2650691 [Trichonephila clavipes]|nr:hypothetical protein TNCV_2650691 [Trichonephila clavipes]